MKFTWKIENFSRLNAKKLYSEVFVVGGYKWRVLIYPKGNKAKVGKNVDHLSIYLDVADSATLPDGWSEFADFSLAVVNKLNSKQSVKKDAQHNFNATNSDFGFPLFMPLRNLNDPSRGFLENDTCVVEAEVVIQRRLKEEQEKEEDDDRRYTIIKVARDEDLAEQIGRDRYFDLVDHDKVHSFRFQNQTPFNLFKEEVAKEFGIPVRFQRFWIWVKRLNNTYRPDRPLTPQEEAQSVGQIRVVSNKTHNAELKLFLEVNLRLDLHPIPPPVKTKEDILLFFKLYDPEKGELRYVGRLFVKSYSKPIEILEKLNKMSGFAPDEEIELYEEIKFKPSVMCKQVNKRTSFRSSEIEDGDIICFQKSPPTESEEECQYPNVPLFLEYVHNYVHSDGTIDKFKKEKLEKKEDDDRRYTIIKVARDEDLAEQIGRDRYFDLVDHDKVRSFRFQNQTPFNLFKEEVAKEFGIPVQFQRFWIWVKRLNNTYRPDRPLTPQEEAQSVVQIRVVSNKTHNAELKLFLEVNLRLDLHPIPPPVKTKEDILLFFKLYDPEKGELRYVGRLFVKSYSKPIEILEKLNKMSGFAPDEEIVLYEEIKFEPSVMCKQVNKRTSFRSSEIGDGDIIFFQKSPLTESEEECQYPNVPSFLEYVLNDVHSDGTIDKFKKEKLEKEKLEEEKKKKESEHRLMKEKEKLQTEVDEHKRREEEKKRKEEEERVRKEEEEREQREAEEQKQNEEENRHIKKRKLEERKYIEEVVKEQKALSSPESNQDKDQAIQSLKINPVASVVPPQILISDSSDKDIEEAEEIERELSGMVAVSLTSSLSSSGSSWPSVGDLSLGLGKLEELLEIEDPKKVLADPSLYSSFKTVVTLLLQKPEFLGHTKFIALRCFCYDLHLIQNACTKSLELEKTVEAKETVKKAALEEADGFITRLNSTKSSLENMRDRKEKLLRELNQLEHNMVEARIQLKQILEEKDRMRRTSTNIKVIEASLQEAKQELEQELELIDDKWFTLRSAFKK